MEERCYKIFDGASGFALAFVPLRSDEWGMNKTLRTMRTEFHEEELNALNVVVLALKNMTFDQQWRILNYVVVRLWNRSWTLNKPTKDTP